MEVIDKINLHCHVVITSVVNCICQGKISRNANYFEIRKQPGSWYHCDMLTVAR